MGRPPKKLLSLVAGYTQSDVDGQRICWSSAAWKRTLGPRYARILSVLQAATVRDAGLTRAAVHSVAQTQSAQDLLIAAMAWGFGTTGYGAWRTKEMLSNPAGISTIVATARSQGAVAGYRALWGNASHVPRMGTAFGTKLLYFAAYHTDIRPRPLIYDANVWRGLTKVGLTQYPSPSRLGVRDYAAYLELAEEAARLTGRPPEIVEYALFRLGRGRRRPPRKKPQSPANPPSRPRR